MKKARWIGLGLLLLPAGLLVLALMLAAPSGRWEHLPSMVSSLMRRGVSGRYSPARVPQSGSAPIDMEPAPGWRIRAPAHALDQPRTLQATPLTDAEVVAMARNTGLSAAYPISGFKLDAGMEPHERFPGELTLSWDLERAGIPRKLWPNVGVLQRDEAGGVFDLLTEIRGSTLEFRAEKNAVFLTYLIYTAGITIIPSGLAILYERDLALVPPGPYIPFRLPEARQFTVHLGADRIPFPNPAEVTRVLRGMNEIRARNNLPLLQQDLMGPGRGAVHHQPADSHTFSAELQLLEDPAYDAFVQRWKNPAWLREHVIPGQVYHAALALDRARSYLQREGFRWPTYTINAWLPRQRMGMFGYMANGWFTRPFVVLNTDSIPAVREGSPGWDDAARARLDSIHVTALHELFHVVQTRYFWLPEVLNHDAWFWEATAVLVEDDAERYYRSQPGWGITYWDQTMGTYQPFWREMDFTEGSVPQRQEHGYGMARFLMYLRDQYLSQSPSCFLRLLLEDYSALRGGRMASLHRVTSNDASKLGQDYAAFVRSIADDLFTIPGFPHAVLTPDAPHTLWAHRDIRNLRSEVLELRLKVPGSNARPLDGAVLVLRDEAENLAELGVDYDVRTWNPFSNRWMDLGKGFQRAFRLPERWEERVRAPMVTRRLETQGGRERMIETRDENPAESFLRFGIPIRLQRIEPRIMSLYNVWNRSAGKGVHAFVLFKPEGVPRMQVAMEENRLHIRIPPSRLVREGFIEGYRVTLERWESSGWGEEAGGPSSLKAVAPRLSFFLPLNEHEIDISIFMGHGVERRISQGVLGPFTLAEFSEMMEIWRAVFMPAGELRVVYEEVVSAAEGIIGPESEVFTVPLESAETRFNPSGRWEGRVWLARKPITLQIEGQHGGTLTGTMLWGGEELGVNGTWVQDQKGWEVSLVAREEGGIGMAGFITVYLRPLPENRLWLTVPPVVLRNAAYESASSRNTGWWGWLRSLGSTPEDEP